MARSCSFGPSDRAGNRRFGPLSALRAHTKAPYKIDYHRKTLMALNRPKAARTLAEDVVRGVRHDPLEVRFGRIDGLCHRSSTLYQIR
jgi:hypothetical protein